MKKALLLYSSKNKENQAFVIISQIALHIAEHARDIEYEIYDIKKISHLNLGNYSAILLGATVGCHKFDTHFLNFVKQHEQTLNSMKTAFFSVSLIARKQGKDTPESNKDTKKLLAKIGWKPSIKQVFAGSLCYPIHGWLYKRFIKFIMGLSGEKHCIKRTYNYTDKQKVDNFSEQFIALVRQA